MDLRPALFLVCAISSAGLLAAALEPRVEPVQHLGKHMSRQLVDGQWRYTLIDVGVRCSWSADQAPVCEEVSP